jgi:hypothetical protein
VRGLGAAALMAVFCATGAASAQDIVAPSTAQPRFSRLPQRPAEYPQALVALPTFADSWTYSGFSYGATIVGRAPSTGASTTVPVDIFPIKLVFGSTAFNPKTVQSNGKTALANTLASPLFKSGIDFDQGGTNLGNTQYIDAFQRANFWGSLASHPNWHLLLQKPVVLPEQTIKVPAADGGVSNPFGPTAGLADINWFDGVARSLLASHAQIQPNAIALFMTYDTYLYDSSGCCIGGYHSASGNQTYSHFSYISSTGIFAQDVSALSHELGEWAEDPFVNNTNTPCGILEVGDPLEGFPNYGDFSYLLSGFTYHLQDLVLLPYFGAPPSSAVNSWFTFQGQSVSVCQYGP